MRVVAAMSGGVDSSVAAALLVDAGHDVVGVSMQLYDQGGSHPALGTCCTLDDLTDARRVATALGIPHYIVNLERRFEEVVIADFVREYAAGRTPIPCAHCNSDLKFSALVDQAMAFGAEAVATGHYARITRDVASQFHLWRGEGPGVLSLRPDAGAAGSQHVPGGRTAQIGCAAPGLGARAGGRGKAG
jgi:tRNA-specific 2-thiouridylase